MTYADKEDCHACHSDILETLESEMYGWPFMPDLSWTGKGTCGGSN